MNNRDTAPAVWKRQYKTDFALLNTHQEEIEFLQDLLKVNKKKITELEEEKLSITENQTKLSNLEDLQELLFSKLKIARRQKLVLPTYETPEAQKISTELSSETTPKRKPHTFFIAHQKNMGIPRGKAWINFKSLANESKGEKQIEIIDFGKIYLKRDRSDLENQVLWSPIKFESTNDGTEITKTAFDKAYDRHNTDIKDITKT
ncbi:MAG TPA: hypothetical protein EYN97_12435 [Candidatus Lambdaproteobacteria bacterium]|jgi:hypothetical protein|nr:hypothetical protein [Candidatus Lambdaproteobacteria bacterium]